MSGRKVLLHTVPEMQKNGGRECEIENLHQKYDIFDVGKKKNRVSGRRKQWFQVLFAEFRFSI